jgi:hypothetical protein
LFDLWTANRPPPSPGTNSGTDVIAFQGWHKFKEAFPPELIRQAIEAQPVEVTRCIDPFGGSGTTALAAQFLGVGSTTIEVNPFLADVIRAKLCHMDPDALAADLAEICSRTAQSERRKLERLINLPETFIEPGRAGRWIFDLNIAFRLESLLVAIDQLSSAEHRRFFRVILAGVLIGVSNVRVNGKGRRYRQGWASLDRDPSDVDRAFLLHARRAIVEVHKFSSRPKVSTSIICGDARAFRTRRMHELAIFSPPYPNSFDYTDVYNVELWTLGYLAGADANRALRASTLTSHVQINRRFAQAPKGSALLDATLVALTDARDKLWSPWLPSMVGAYFSDLLRVLGRVRDALHAESSCWIVIGDSKYANTHVPSAQILRQLASRSGWLVTSMDPFRSMRSSSQHGGATELHETLLVLKRS